jgi:hypothetical protein
VTEEHLKLREAYVRVLDIDAELQKLLALLKEAVSPLPPQAHLDAQARPAESQSGGDASSYPREVCPHGYHRNCIQCSRLAEQWSQSSPQ